MTLAVAAQANIFDLSHNWNALKVSWNILPIKGFDRVPRSLAENNGQFQIKDDLCAIGKGKMVGQRWWQNKDPSLMLLFDKNGFIAGIQTALPKSKFTPPAPLQI